jgi:hypothetical protein
MKSEGKLYMRVVFNRPRSSGYTASAAKNHELALMSILSDTSPILILLDLLMQMQFNAITPNTAN